MSKIILYIATSLDGFIADSNGGVDWLPHPDDSEDWVGFKVLMERIGVIVMGSRSYKQILGFGEWAWPDKHTYVFTSQSLPTAHASIKFVKENPKVFIEALKAKVLKRDIWLLGGAELIKSFAKEKLIDECIITVIPVNLGNGIKLELSLNDFQVVSKKLCINGIEQTTLHLLS